MRSMLCSDAEHCICNTHEHRGPVVLPICVLSQSPVQTLLAAVSALTNACLGLSSNPEQACHVKQRKPARPVQVLPDAVSALTNPCLGLSQEYPWAFVFAGAFALLTLTLEMALRGFIFKYGFHPHSQLEPLLQPPRIGCSQLEKVIQSCICRDAPAVAASMFLLTVRLGSVLACPILRKSCKLLSVLWGAVLEERSSVRVPGLQTGVIATMSA